VRGQVDRGDPGEGLSRGAAAGVGGGAGRAARADPGGEVDDAAAVAGVDHRAGRGLGHQERAAAVDRVDGVPHLGGFLEQAGVRGDGGVVDAEVEGAEFRDGGADDLGGAFRGPDVGRDAADLVRVMRLTGHGQAVLVPVGGQYAGAGCGEGGYEAAADPAGGACDDRDPAGVVEADVHRATVRRSVWSIVDNGHPVSAGGGLSTGATWPVTLTAWKLG